MPAATPGDLRLVGHMGADAICTGNTIESYLAGEAHGAGTIEVDALWTRDGDPSLPAESRTPLICAHDFADAAGRPHLTLDEALAAFTQPPLDRVEIDIDIKQQGREDDVVAALIRHDLVSRAIATTMELESLDRLRTLCPDLRRGWSYPRVTRDWTAHRWAAPGVLGALVVMRTRLPRVVPRQAERLGLHGLWVYHRLITPQLVRATRSHGIELVAWTVDDEPTMRRLIGLGVTGIVSNDPRLFARL